MSFIGDVGTVIIGCLLFVCIMGGVVWVIQNAENIPLLSKIARDDELSKNNKTVLIKKDVMGSLNIMFESYTQEFFVCLEVEENKHGFLILGMNSTRIYDQSEEEVRHKACLKDFKGYIHNHPNNICDISIQDAFSFGDSKHTIISCIICDPNKIICRDRLLNEYNVGVMK